MTHPSTDLTARAKAVLANYDLRDQIHGLGPDVAELIEALAALAAPVPVPPPPVEVGDVVLTERGRLLRVGQINERPAHLDAATWQGADRNFVDLTDDASALNVAVVAVYRPFWQRRKET